MEILRREFEIEHLEIEDQRETLVLCFPGKSAGCLSIPDHFADQEFFTELITYAS